LLEGIGVRLPVVGAAAVGGTRLPTAASPFGRWGISERKKRAAEAYNSLVQSWPEITRLAREKPTPATATGDMFNQE
jgi:putative DNA methylase